MQKYIQQLDRDPIHKKHSSRRQKKFFKDPSSSKQQLLQKYQKELKDLLQHNPAKGNAHVQPLQSHIFLDWQEHSPTNKKHHSQYKIMESKHSEKRQWPQENALNHRKSNSLRKCDKLIMSRYNMLTEKNIMRVTKRYRHNNHSEIRPDKYSPISKNQPAFVLPAIREKSLDNRRLETQPIQLTTNQSQLETEQNSQKPKITLPLSEQLHKEGSHTVIGYRSSRNRSSHLKNSNTIDNTANIERLELEKDYLNEKKSPAARVSPQELNKTFNESEFTQTQQSLTSFGKKTVFYRKLHQEKLALPHELSNLSKKMKKPIALPTKQSITQFLNSYQSMDPTFDIKALIQSSLFGIIKFKDAIYIGDCLLVEEGKQLRHGKGVYISKKLQFEGEFQNNEKKYGTQVTEQGIYKGQFKNGMRNGKGQFRWHNGEYYNGEWQNNKKHGSGIWTSSVLSSGENQVPDSYMGEWQAGSVHGYGVHTWNNAKNRYEGQFKNFLKHGRGIEKFENGDRYDGYYKEGKADGYGEYFWADGSYYKGSFVAGLRQGIGVWLEVTKDRYEGFLKEDCKHGLGILYYANGDIFQGEFSMDSREGPGLLTLASRQEVIKGVWKYNHIQTD